MNFRKMSLLFIMILFGLYLLFSMNHIGDYNGFELKAFHSINVLFSLILAFIIFNTYFNRTYSRRSEIAFEGYFTSLFEHNPSPVFLLDKSGKIIRTNSTVLSILDYNNTELSSRTFWSLFNVPEEQDFIKDQFEKVGQGNPITFMANIPKKNGTCVNMKFTLIPHIDKKGFQCFFITGNDITELRKYQDRILKTQIELRNTVRQQQGMIFKYIKKGDTFIHTLCDGELVHKLGLSSKKVVGKSLNDFLPQSDVDFKNLYYDKAWAGEITSYEGQMKGVSYLVQLSPVFKEGKVIEVIGSCIDITDRKIVEEELRKKENLYRTVLTTMSDGIFLISKSGVTTDLNENVEQILGIRSGFLTESTTKESGIEFVREDGTNIAYKDLPGNISNEKGMEVNNFIMGVKVRGRIKKWISVSSKPLNLPDEEPASLVSFHDISVQKEQEMKIKEANALNQALIDNIRTGIIVADENRNILFMNKSAMLTIGIDDGEEVVGRCGENFHYLFAKSLNFNEQIKKIIMQKLPTTEVIETDSGGIFRRNYVPINLDKKRKLNLWTFDDITEISKLQKSALKAKEEAIKANMAKSDFLSKMSHELRTPLNGILGFAQLLELEESFNERQKKFVTEILKSGEHLVDLINEILDFSRIETGKLKLSLEVINLTDLIDECIGMVRPMAEKRKINIKALLDNITDIHVKADPVRLRQVVLNLLDNAIKYNVEEGEIEIYGDKGMDHISIFLKDSGIGFHSEKITDIFEPFYRIKGTNVEGTGIGLPLSKQLIQMMGGTIGATSTIGKGSTFWFNLAINNQPVLKESNDDCEIYDTEDNKENRKHTILYIEDNQSNIDLLKEIMASQPNYSLLYAKDGLEGLTIANKENIDLILLDMNLPDISGYQVFDELKKHENTAKIPVIALSANAINKDIKEALHNGFDDYITKPLNINELLSKIKKHL